MPTNEARKVDSWDEEVTDVAPKQVDSWDEEVVDEPVKKSYSVTFTNPIVIKWFELVEWCHTFGESIANWAKGRISANRTKTNRPNECPHCGGRID